MSLTPAQQQAVQAFVLARNAAVDRFNSDMLPPDLPAASARFGAAMAAATAALLAAFDVEIDPPPPPPPDALVASEEFVGPLAGWAVVATISELQAALAQPIASRPAVIYLMPGDYIVSNTAVLDGGSGFAIIGADPATVRLIWTGESGGTLLHINGVSYSRFSRMTLDGGGVCGALVDQGVTDFNGGRTFDTGNEYSDIVFRNAQIGIIGGKYDKGASETSVVRCTFDNITPNGVILKNFNALDWWLRHCRFVNCGTGVTNNPGAGNYNVYNSVFIDSASMDMNYLNTGNFNIRDNYSRNTVVLPNGRKFFEGTFFYTNAAATIEQGNRVDGGSLFQGNMGPHVYLDNVIRNWSPNSQATRAPDVISVGGLYHDPVVCLTDGQPGRLVSLDDVVDANQPALIEPALPGAPAKAIRPIIEVADGDGAGFQAAVNVVAIGQRTVVHVPPGTYNLPSELVIPAGCDVQIVGDGIKTRINGSIRCLSPARAVLRDFYLNPGTGEGITVENADQVGARVYIYKSDLTRATVANLFVDGVVNTLVEGWDIGLRDTLIAPASTGAACKVTGGKVRLLSGSGGNNYLSFDVSGASDVVVRDMWFEAEMQTFARVSGAATFTFEGTRVAMPQADRVVLDFVDFTGKALVMGNSLSVAPVPSQLKVQANAGSTGQMWVLGCGFSKPPVVTGPISVQSCRYDDATNGSIAINDNNPLTDPVVMRDMLAQSRSTHPSAIEDLPAGVTDLRIYRVMVEQGSVGIHVKGAAVEPPPPPPPGGGDPDTVWLGVGRCIVTRTGCPSHPTLSNTVFLDHDFQDLSSPSQCAARAAQNYEYCGSPVGEAVGAYFYGPDGYLVQPTGVGVVGNPAILPAMPNRILRESDMANIHFPDGPPPPPSEEPHVEITPASGGSLTDSAGHVWTLNGPYPGLPDAKVMKDGQWAYEGGAMVMTMKPPTAGVIYVRNSFGTWWRDTGLSWMATANPYPGAGFPPVQGEVPPIPTEVAAMGFTVQTFFDGFDSINTIDVNNTQVSGKNWYVQAYFCGPNVSYANPGPPWAHLSPDKIAVANSVMTLSGDVSGFGEGLVSTVDNNVPFAQRPPGTIVTDQAGPFYSVDAAAYKGVAFDKGFYVEFCKSFDPTPYYTQQPAWATDWSMPQKLLTGADSPDGHGRDYAELDFTEAMLWLNSFCMAVNIWHNPRSPSAPNFQTNGNARAPLNVDYNQWNIFATHFVPSAENAGHGFVKRYVNGVHHPEFDIIWTAGDGNPFGQLLDSNGPIALILGTLDGKPVHYDWIRVTQKSAAHCIGK